MKEMHNIRLEVSLREQIKAKGLACGNAWTKQLQLDLAEIYDVETPIPNEPAQLKILRKHAQSCGISIQDLIQRCVSVLQIQAVPLWPNAEEDVERNRAVQFPTPVVTTSGVDTSSWLKRETARLTGAENQNMGEN